MILNTQMGRISTETAAVYINTFLEGLRKRANILNRKSRCPDLDSNRTLPEHKPEGSSRVLTCSLKFDTGDVGLYLKPVDTFNNFSPQWSNRALFYNKFISNTQIL
jgi:hypothetical protein